MSPSWQARAIAVGVRVLIRRRSWGPERRLTARARRLFGAPRPWQWIRCRGLEIRAVSAGSVRGEWLLPEVADPGAILYVHGGGYVSCSPATHRPITAALARYARRPVFSLAYRLAPEHRFPAALDDTVRAYRWLLEEGFPAHTIALAGDSAGGGRVLAALMRVREAELPGPACAVCFSPWTDLTGESPSNRLNDGRCAMFRPENIGQFAAAYLGSASSADPYASPVLGDLRGLAPLLRQVGSTELLLDDARRVHQKVQAGGPDPAAAHRTEGRRR